MDVPAKNPKYRQETAWETFRRARNITCLPMGLDTEGVTTKEKVMRKFPDAEELPPPIGANRLGDFDTSKSPILAASPTPTPTPTKRPLHRRRPFADAIRQHRPQLLADAIHRALTNRQTVTPSPTPTATPRRGHLQRVPPMATATLAATERVARPVSSATAWPATETVLFKFREPRVVYDGQFVHFINKTWPPPIRACGRSDVL